MSHLPNRVSLSLRDRILPQIIGQCRKFSSGMQMNSHSGSAGDIKFQNIPLLTQPIISRFNLNDVNIHSHQSLSNYNIHGPPSSKPDIENPCEPQEEFWIESDINTNIIGKFDENSTNNTSIECKQHWFRKLNRQRGMLKGMLKLRKTDCGPRGNLWEWWRDRQISRKKKKNYI